MEAQIISSTDFLNIAIQYHQAGLICMPVKETKGPNLPSYANYHKQAASLEVIKAWPWTSPSTYGVGIFTGRPSGDLIVLDFDLKYDNTGDLFTRWMELIPDEMKRLFVVAETRSGGYHIYYRCVGTETKNIKLAKRYTTTSEREKNPHELQKVLIETRGIGGIIVCAPTPGYKWIQGDQSDIKNITAEEETFLLDTCISFNEVVIEHKPVMQGTEYKLSAAFDPTEDYDNKCDMDMLLQSHGWEPEKSKGSKAHYKRPGDSKAKNSGNYDHDLKWFSVFSTSTQFETNKAYRPWMVYAVLEHDSDFKAAWHALKDQGYGKTISYDSSVVNKVRKYLDSGNEGDALQYLDICFKSRETADAHLAKAKEPIVKIENAFWYLETNDKGKEKLIISASALISFMSRSGFYKHYPTGNIDPVYIRIKNGVASIVNTNQIVDFIDAYIMQLPFEFDGTTRTKLYNLVFHSSGSYFSETKIEWLRENKRKFIRDTKESAFIFFNNCVVEVIKGEYEITDYATLGDNIVWKHQVRDLDFTFENPDDCIFHQFMKLVSTGLGRYETNTKILGYLMHRFKNPAKTYAIIGCEDLQNGDEGGGTGKSLIGVALGKIVPATFIEAKHFDSSKSFPWQSYTLGDSLINMDDLNQKFSIEDINSQITGGFTVERKNKPSVTIPFEDSPKFYLTTNHGIDESAAHTKRRIRKLILTPFFSRKLKPDIHFKHNFFDDWDPNEWNKFYSYMITTLGAYLKDPEIEDAESDILTIKAFITKYTAELYDFLLNASTLDTYTLKQEGQQVSVKDRWYPNFLTFSGQESRTYSMKRFSQGMKAASESELMFPTLKSTGSSRASEYHFH